MVALQRSALREGSKHSCLLAAMQNEIGKGSFQELDQVSAVTMYTKWRGAPNSVAAIPGSLQSALQVLVWSLFWSYYHFQM